LEAHTFRMAGAIVSWKDRAERARKALAKAREELDGNIVHTRHDLEAVGAGLLAGTIRGAALAAGKDYSIPAPGGSKIPPEVPAGLLLLGLAFSGQTEASADLHAAASGVLAYIGGRQAEEWMRTRPARNGAPKP
jgi:hypothetical protein